MKLDERCRYAKTHEWARRDGSELVIGISDHAQHSLGDIVFVDLPKVGVSFGKGAAFGVVESVKAASDIYVPVAGKVTAVNTQLQDAPDLINKDPYGDGWIIRLVPEDPAAFDSLLSPAEYEKIAAEE
ncbi:MAG TPA: glycine cleavage system protein GcvH [Treponema sp.]|jgi:glycine cleavage system H protein|nr:glycine cleavage system protein GcvH [Treponema sp.]HPC72355.1 glycine cleavage system protein GcvH [Treponema sp.]HRS05098.1 glycine cleavage system protein GcvH [Treponema sp.]HRU29587.1 glycine cleavage system protein GcvH [Treponema sp.]